MKALMNLENSASSDANIRERIASLPPEVSEISLLTKLEDKEAAAKLAAQVRYKDYFQKYFYVKINEKYFYFIQKVNEAAQILHEYNTRLSNEMEDRKKLTAMLKDFQTEQKELLTQAEQRLEVHKIPFKCGHFFSSEF